MADALAHYVSPECVKFKCPDDACPERSIHVGARVAFIAPLPPVLILHLKRFLLNEKNNSTVFLSLTVEMPGHPDTHFKLYAVTCHLGASLHGGHYVTFFRKMNTTGEERWFLADDATVKVVSADTVLGMTKCKRKGKSSFNSRKTAYLLFYEQQQGGYKPEAEPIPKSSTRKRRLFSIRPRKARALSTIFKPLWNKRSKTPTVLEEKPAHASEVTA